VLLLLALACKKDESTTDEAVAITIAPTSPRAGDFVDDGELQVEGRVTGLTDVTVNGAPAVLAGGAFSARIEAERGIVPIEVSGLDRNGGTWTHRYSVEAGDFAPAKGVIEDAVQLRLNRAGLEDIAGLVAELLDPDVLLADLATGTPIYNVYFDSVWPLDDTDVDIYLTALRFEPLVLRADPSPGVLHVDARLPSFEVELQTYGTIPLLDNTEGDVISMSASEVHLAADVSLEVRPDGQVRAGLENPTVAMPDFDITWDYLWDGVDWVVDLFLDLQTLVEDALLGALEGALPPILEGVFGALNTSFELALFDQTLELGLQLATIEADADGVVVGGHLSVDLPSALVREEGGWLTSRSARAPSPSRTAPIALAVSDDFLNRALYEVWAANLISLKLSTDDGSLDPLMLAALGATQGDISVVAGLPPVIVQRGNKFVAQLGEIGLVLDTPGGDNGDHLDVVVGGEAELELEIVDDELRLSIGEPDLRFQVVDSDWGASNDTITALLEEQLPIDVLLLLLGSVAFPLPEIPYVSIDHATAERDPSGAHTDLEVFLR
jgi:hypothetical protein